MVKEELAKIYAEENCTDYKNALQAAFEKGFEAGKQLAEEKRIVIDGVEYVDLGLPSGTLWSAKPYSEESFPEANKLNIPTLEDWKEVHDYCKVTDAGGFTDNWIYNIKGLNGKIVKFNLAHNKIYSWYQIPGSIPQKNIPAISLQDLVENRTPFTSNLFAGTELQIMLVKRKGQ